MSFCRPPGPVTTAKYTSNVVQIKRGRTAPPGPARCFSKPNLYERLQFFLHPKFAARKIAVNRIFPPDPGLPDGAALPCQRSLPRHRARVSCRTSDDGSQHPEALPRPYSKRKWGMLAARALNRRRGLGGQSWRRVRNAGMACRPVPCGKTRAFGAIGVIVSTQPATRAEAKIGFHG